VVPQLDHQTPARPIAGILQMPALFGAYSCDRFVPEPVEVYRGPSAESVRMGVLETLTPWYREPEGDCEWIEVGFRADGIDQAVPVRLMEYSYEEPGLVVAELSGEWFAVELADAVGWVRSDESDQFHSYPDLVLESLAYLTPGFSGELWSAPVGGTPLRLPEPWLPFLATELTVEVLEVREVGGVEWFHVRLDADYGCGSLAEDLPTVDGWLPGYAAAGGPTLWFYSRGC